MTRRNLPIRESNTASEVPQMQPPSRFVFPSCTKYFREGEPFDPSWMDQPVPRHYFDVNKRIEQLRSYMDREMHRNQIDDIKATSRLYEEGV